MYAQLGSIIFEGRKGFESFVSTKETNYAEHALIDGKPRLQKVGENLEQNTITVVLDASFCNPQSEFDALESSRRSAEVLPFIMGDGRFVGTFVIKGLTLTHARHSATGEMLQAEVSISLLEFASGDRLVSQAAQSAQDAFANPLNDPQTVAGFFEESTPAAVAMAAVVATNASVETAAGIMEDLPVFPSVYRTNTERIIQNMLRAGDQVNTVLQVINADPASELYERTRELAVKAEEIQLTSNSVKVEAETLIQAIDGGDVSGIADGVATISDQSTEVSRLSDQFMSSSSSLTTYLVTQ
jgi:phage protein U